MNHQTLGNLGYKFKTEDKMLILNDNTRTVMFDMQQC